MRNYLYLFNFFLLVLQAFANESKLLEDFIEANRKFAADVYQETIRSSTGNLVICPMSAEVILGLTRFGAKGNTAKELALHIKNNDEDTKNIFIQLNKKLDASDKYVLSSANNIFLSDKYVVKDEFKNTAYSDFKAGVQNVDFSRNQEAVDYINSWVEKRTQDKIKRLLSTDQVSVDTAAVLINAMYFRGNWIDQFDPRASFNYTFHVNEHLTVETATMTTLGYFNYIDNKDLEAQILEMPFEGDEVTMTFVLPKEKFGLHKLENRISEVLLPQNYKKVEVDVSMPKFKIESQIDLKPVLQSMGVRDAFSNRADFSGISDSQPPLLIDEVIQKTFLEINEKGATAAASTAVVITPFSSPMNEFIANHPFLFYLKHKTSGILFIGKFVAPTN